ncbi:MAG: hypothetical protein KF718_02965 [Polyangiaceae bacterium]|nr:hypothetical protein [Polyangiaceae bacterium]
MKRFAAHISLLLAVVACSSKKDGELAVNPYATEHSFCTQWAKAACNPAVVGKCSGGGADTDACVQSQTNYCLANLPDNYAPDDAKACVEYVKSAYQDAKLTAAELAVVRDFGAPCNTLSRGPIGAGSACVKRSDCDTVDGFDCIVRPGEPSGTCQLPVTVGGGDPCGEPQLICPSTHYCDGNNCLTRIKEGSACSETQPCAESLRCSEVNGSSICVAKSAGATNCASNDECSSGVCAFGIGASVGKCVAELDLGVTVSQCEDLS